MPSDQQILKGAQKGLDMYNKMNNNNTGNKSSGGGLINVFGLEKK